MKCNLFSGVLTDIPDGEAEVSDIEIEMRHVLSE